MKKEDYFTTVLIAVWNEKHCVYTKAISDLNLINIIDKTINENIDRQIWFYFTRDNKYLSIKDLSRYDKPLYNFLNTLNCLICPAAIRIDT